MYIEHYRSVSLEIKSIDEKGTFTGYASVFGNTDSYNDIVVKGAFKRTIAHKSGKWPILWQHKDPIGANVSAEEDDYGLKVSGKIFLDMEKGKEAYAWVKNAVDAGLPVGLSIGFRIVDKAIEDGKRMLKEIALMEYSIVTFPANELANVAGVKSLGSQAEVKAAMDFSTALTQELNERALQELRWTIDSARYDALHSIEDDTALSVEKKVELVGAVYTQYGSAMTAWYVKYFALVGATEDSDATDKSGAVISAKTKKLVSTAVDMSTQGQRMIREGSRMHSKAMGLFSVLVGGVASQEKNTDDLPEPKAPQLPPVLDPERKEPPVEEKSTDPKLVEALGRLVSRMKS